MLPSSNGSAPATVHPLGSLRILIGRRFFSSEWAEGAASRSAKPIAKQFGGSHFLRASAFYMAFAVPVWEDPRDDAPSLVLFFDRQPTVTVVLSELKNLLRFDDIHIAQSGSHFRRDSVVNCKKGQLVYNLVNGQVIQFVTGDPNSPSAFPERSN
jgi:hypothetical protein